MLIWEFKIFFCTVAPQLQLSLLARKKSASASASIECKFCSDSVGCSSYTMQNWNFKLSGGLQVAADFFPEIAYKLLFGYLSSEARKRQLQLRWAPEFPQLQVTVSVAFSLNTKGKFSFVEKLWIVPKCWKPCFFGLLHWFMSLPHWGFSINWSSFWRVLVPAAFYLNRSDRCSNRRL